MLTSQRSCQTEDHLKSVFSKKLHQLCVFTACATAQETRKN